MDRFWHSRCLNDHMDLSDMIGTLASGANASLVAKNWTKTFFLLLLIKSLPVDGFWCLRCLTDRIYLPHMIGSLASGATKSLVAKIWTNFIAIYNGRIWMFKVSKRPYWSLRNDNITCKWCHFLHGGQKLN